MAFVEGYTVFLPGRWDVPTFLFSYTMIGVLPALFVIWKVVHKTHVSLCPHYHANLFECRYQWRKLHEISFFEDERLVVDAHEAYCSTNSSFVL